MEEKTSLVITIITASAGVVGVILGSIITSIVSWKLKTKELQLKFVEQIFQKRIKAYEELLSFIQFLRSTMPTGKIDKNGYAITPLVIYVNKEQHDKFQILLYNLLNNNCHFLNYDIYIELNLLQTFEVNLNNYFLDTNLKNWEEMSLLFKADYIRIANRLNELALLFFEKEIYSIKIKTNRGNYQKLQNYIKEKISTSDFAKNKKILDKFIGK